MADNEKPSPAADLVRGLAREGRLAAYFREASDDERRWLRTGAAELAWQLVFRRVTRPIERGRGHHRCATGVQRLAADCLDHFHDDLDAVLDDLFAHSKIRIENLEGWLTARIPRATVDGHRRRRGARGAPQRPRVPVWLGNELGGDVWLVELAKLILDWSGNETTAGRSLWPLGAWATRRAAATGDYAAGERVVAAEIEEVLTAMRRRTAWYEKTVERPLGRKWAPVWSPSGHAEPEPLVTVEAHERDEALLKELAAGAIEVMKERIAGGEDPGVVVPSVLNIVFGALPASHDLDRTPGADWAAPDQAAALIADPVRRAEIVAAVIDLVTPRGGRSHRPSVRTERRSTEGDETR